MRGFILDSTFVNIHTHCGSIRLELAGRRYTGDWYAHATLPPVHTLLESIAVMLDNFKSIIRADIEEFIATQKMEKARELKHATGHHFNHNEYPMYFTGKLDAELVLVHLNPKQQNNDAETYMGHLRWPTFEDYFSYHQYYGRHTYGPQTSRSWKSLFDQKQIRFIRPFGV